MRYRCPACGFQIFNRRVQKCEKCGAALPSELLLTREQIAVLDGEHAKSRKEQEARRRAARSRGSESDGGDSGGSWDVGDGDGGAGD